MDPLIRSGGTLWSFVVPEPASHTLGAICPFVWVILGVYFSKKTEIDTYLWNRKFYKLEGQFLDQIDAAIDFDNGRRTEAEMKARKGKRIKDLDQQILEHEAKRPMARKRKGAQQNN